MIHEAVFFFRRAKCEEKANPSERVSNNPSSNLSLALLAFCRRSQMSRNWDAKPQEQEDLEVEQLVHHPMHLDSVGQNHQAQLDAPRQASDR